MTEHTVIAVKAAAGDGDTWELDVLGVPYGGPNNGRDSDGEYFSAATNLYLDKYPTVPAVYYHGFDENGVPASEPQIIGKTTGYTVKPDGVWFRVALDKANDYARRVWEAAKNGIARASSGSISHLRRVGRDGHITHWPVAELSIFDAVGNRQPANQYAVAMPVMKAVYAQAGMSLPDDIEGEDAAQPEAGAIGDKQSAPAAKADDTPQGDTTITDDSPKEGIMDEQNISASMPL